MVNSSEIYCTNQCFATFLECRSVSRKRISFIMYQILSSKQYTHTHTSTPPQKPKIMQWTNTLKFSQLNFIYTFFFVAILEYLKKLFCHYRNLLNNLFDFFNFKFLKFDTLYSKYAFNFSRIFRLIFSNFFWHLFQT